MRGIQLFMQSLAAQGVRYIFGNPGTTETTLMDSLTDYPQIQYILALHEGVAVGMADAYALATGQVSVVNLHVAPGLGNGLGMLFNAWEGRSPILITAGQPDSRLRLRDPLLSHDLVAMAAPLTKWSVRVERADELPLLLHRAFKIAQEPPSGPVFMALPLDVMEQESDIKLFPTMPLFTQARADLDAMEKAAQFLLAAKNPVIVCGDGVFRSAAQPELVAVAELVGAPVWNTLLTSAVNFPMAHPQFRGELTDNHARIRQLLNEPDAVLLVGGTFFREVFYTPQSPWPEEASVIQMDAARETLARNFAISVGLAANLKIALRELYALMSERAGGDFLAAAAERKRALSQLKAEENRRQEERLQAGWDARPMTHARVMVELKAALPPNVVVVGELTVGRADLIRTMHFERPGDYYGSRGGGIGQGLPGAIGYKLAQPDRPLLAISGDGSSLYSIQALWTAAHYRLPIVFVILNDRAYSIVKLNLDRYRNYFGRQHRQGYPFLDLTDPDIDYVWLAQGLGVPARRITEPDQLGPAIQAAFDSGGPYLIEVPIASVCPG